MLVLVKRVGTLTVTDGRRENQSTLLNRSGRAADNGAYIRGRGAAGSAVMHGAEEVTAARRLLVGANLRDAREALGLSQQQLAIRLGIDRRVLSRWETGGREPTAANLQQLALELDVHWTDFYRHRAAA